MAGWQPYLVGASIMAVAICSPAVAQTKALSIQAQPVSSAVRALSVQGGVQILAARKITQGRTARAIQGEMTMEQAFDRLLAGTGLTATETGPQTYTIHLANNARPSQASFQQDVPVSEQTEVASEPQAADIVVTGFRNSLNTALGIKKAETGFVDAIVAEDIGKFPDSNLAESMQRVPGVALARGDGGEGRTITVRGLGSTFTVVRINGIPAVSQIGSSDIFGAGNRGRGFDFSAFPSEIFSSLVVRKTPTADMEEGSLGATVDLSAPRPLDFKNSLTFAGSAKALYTDQANDVSPRLTGLVAWHNPDATFGAALGVSYTDRRTKDISYNPNNVYPITNDGGLCSPVGFTPVNPNPTASGNAAKVVTAANCGTGIPRTSNPAIFTEVNNAQTFFPRQPRYGVTEQYYSRLGVNGTLQFKPDDDTDFALDAIYGRYHVNRDDFYLSGLSFSRGINNNGKPMTSILEGERDPNGSLVYGVFNGVDIASQSNKNIFTSKTKQVTFSGRHKFNDFYEADLLVGLSEVTFYEPVRFFANIYANNVNGWTFDARDRAVPLIDYGVDVSDPANFIFASNLADGTVQSQVGGIKSGTKTINRNFRLNNLFTLSSAVKLKLGAQYREQDFSSYQMERPGSLANLISTPNAGTTLASITRQVDGIGALGSGIADSFVGVDWNKFAAAYNFYTDPVYAFRGPEANTALGNNFAIREQVTAAYAQLQFDMDLGSIPVRGDFGLRYTHTDQKSSGFLSSSTVAIPVTIARSYDNWLPAFNIAADLSPSLTVRAAAAKVIARPNLPGLSPGGSISPNSRFITFGNPLLDPIKANTVDLGLEWYFSRGSLLSVAGFYKDIKTYIQGLVRNVPFTETGLPSGILEGTQAVPTDLFSVSQGVNTPGGPLKGVEVNYQQQYSFLPGPLGNLGSLISYTFVTSDVDYVVNANTGALVTGPLSGLSKHQVSATLYYEDEKFSARSSLNYRSSSIRGIPSAGGTGSDADINGATTFVDASASYAVTDHVRLTLEATNLTNEKLTAYVDRTRKDLLYDIRSGRSFTGGVSIKF